MSNALVLAYLMSAAIHLLPLSGVLGGSRLQALYGVPIGEPTTELAMRHRAVLFGLLGALLGAAAFLPDLRTVALLGGLGSDLAFLALALAIKGTHEAMRKVVIADVISIACLVPCAVAEWV